MVQADHLKSLMLSSDGSQEGLGLHQEMVCPAFHSAHFRSSRLGGGVAYPVEPFGLRVRLPQDFEAASYTAVTMTDKDHKTTSDLDLGVQAQRLCFDSTSFHSFQDSRDDRVE